MPHAFSVGPNRSQTNGTGGCFSAKVASLLATDLPWCAARASTASAPAMLTAACGARAAFARVAVEALAPHLAEALVGAASDAAATLRAVGTAIARPAAARSLVAVAPAGAVVRARGVWSLPRPEARTARSFSGGEALAVAAAIVSKASIGGCHLTECTDQEKLSLSKSTTEAPNNN